MLEKGVTKCKQTVRTGVVPQYQPMIFDSNITETVCSSLQQRQSENYSNILGVNIFQGKSKQAVFLTVHPPLDTTTTSGANYASVLNTYFFVCVGKGGEKSSTLVKKRSFNRGQKIFNAELWVLTVTEPLGKPRYLRHLAKYSPLISALYKKWQPLSPLLPTTYNTQAHLHRRKKYYWRNRK